MLNAARFLEVVEGKYPELLSADIYLAVSGGKDSIALSHLLKSIGFKHHVLHCNFCLRGKESDDDEQFIRDYCEKNGLPFNIKQFDTVTYASDNGLGIQEAARNLRYEWFESFMTSDKCVLLTAHHLDDSIETFFINLMRGTGTKGLAGIPEHNRYIRRPLSEFSVEEIIDYINTEGIEYRSDSSNSSDKYLRNKIRHHIIPEILDIESDFKVKMKNFFREIRGLNELYEADAQDFRTNFFSERGDIISVKYEALEKVMQRTLLLAIFRPFGLRPSNANELLSLISAKAVGKKFETATHVYVTDREDLLLSKKQSFDISKYNVKQFPEEINLGAFVLKLHVGDDITIVHDEFNQKLDLQHIKLPLTIRKWEEGDRLTPLGMKGTKLVSDILIDKKIDSLSKSKVFVIEDASGELIALPGIAISDRFKITDSTKDVLEIGFIN